MSRDFPTPSNFMVWTPTWTGWLRGTHGLDLVWNFLTAGNWYLRRAVKLLVVRAFDILALRLLFPQGKWIFFHLFEFPLTNMAKATYQNIRKLCSSVFSRKQTLKFAPATMASCDASIQLLFSGDSTSSQLRLLRLNQCIAFSQWALARWMQTISSRWTMKFKSRSFWPRL